ncbi:MAG: FAD-dependent oxidoreductase, partial [bacterium]|nr:FAD-dependent oxidoreductase [bacterium]
MRFGRASAVLPSPCVARLAARCRRRLERHSYGPGVCKLDGRSTRPSPWLAPERGRAATVHLWGTAEEIASSARDVVRVLRAGRGPR